MLMRVLAMNEVSRDPGRLGSLGIPEDLIRLGGGVPPVRDSAPGGAVYTSK